MNTKKTLILTLVALAVAAYLFFVEKPWQVQEEQKPATVVKQLYDPPLTDIDRLEIKSKDTNLVFEKEDDSWMMREPIACRATDHQVKSIIDTVTGLKYVKEYDKN